MTGDAPSLASLTRHIARVHQEAAAEIATSKRLHAEAHALLNEIHISLDELHTIESRGHEVLRRNRRAPSSVRPARDSGG
jgi:hypothetical protein